MYLSTSCKSCKQKIPIKSFEVTRPDLAHAKGEEFSAQCSHCRKRFKVHVNDVNAYPSAWLKIVCVILCLAL